MTDLIRSTELADEPPVPDPPDEPRPSPLARAGASLRAVPGWGTWLGIAVCVAGLALITVAWGAVADETQVAEQVPSVVGAGLGGLGLVVVGVAVVVTDALRRVADRRLEQLRELTALVAELREQLEADR